MSSWKLRKQSAGGMNDVVVFVGPHPTHTHQNAGTLKLTDAELQELDAVLAAPVADVVAAWVNPGPVPAYHNAMKAKLRADWPVLAAALDKLTEGQG